LCHTKFWHHRMDAVITQTLGTCRQGLGSIHEDRQNNWGNSNPAYTATLQEPLSLRCQLCQHIFQQVVRESLAVLKHVEAGDEHRMKMLTYADAQVQLQQCGALQAWPQQELTSSVGTSLRASSAVSIDKFATSPNSSSDKWLFARSLAHHGKAQHTWDSCTG
jgi:hypothetical protein